MWAVSESAGATMSVITLRSSIGTPCGYCGSVMDIPTRDHALIPKHRNGILADWNTVICCERCNREKGAKTLESWFAALAMADDVRADRVYALLMELESKKAIHDEAYLRNTAKREAKRARRKAKQADRKTRKAKRASAKLWEAWYGQ